MTKKYPTRLMLRQLSSSLPLLGYPLGLIFIALAFIDLKPRSRAMKAASM